VERVGALRLGEQLLASTLFLFEDGDLEHDVPAQLAGFELEAGVFRDHEDLGGAKGRREGRFAGYRHSG
jgi:hypothetical protein